MDPVREDLKELRRDLKEGLEGLQASVRGLGDKLSEHALEDADREGRAMSEIGVMRSRLDTLATDSKDGQKFMRGWVAGLIAMALTAGAGFLFRSALERQVQVPPVMAAPVK